jgi:hypothetical protein
MNAGTGFIDITGDVRFWVGQHPATSATLRIGWPGSPPAVNAVVTFTETGGSKREFQCRRESDGFRAANFEIAVCASVNTPPLLPTYDTAWHADRPADLPRRVLTIEAAYREAGVEATIAPTHAVVDDHAPQFQSWTPALLHDAMETYFSQVGGVWPKWQMWGLMAGLFQTQGVGGVMFDAAVLRGVAGTEPERRGFAVFRQHQWFNNLVDGQPQNQDQAWAARHFLYTWVHEAGHGFNFMHAWDKGRPDSLSWMNYDWRYDNRNGTGSFWKRFAFRFDDDELIHMRHGNRASVIMGGDPWSSGSHLEVPNLAMAQIEGAAPVELIVRSKEYFDFMEPVIVELRLRNLLSAMPLVIDKRLPPEYGGVIVYIQGPDGKVEQYDPVMCAVGTPETMVLNPAGAQDGSDRYSREVFLSYGSGDFYFDRPGEYRIRAMYQGPGDMLIPAPVHRIRIGMPVNKELDRQAQDYFTNDVGLTLYLQGSRSPFLSKGRDVLHGLAEQYGNTPLGAKVAVTLANGISQPFYRVEKLDGTKQKLTQTDQADPARALAMTDSAYRLFSADSDKSCNLSDRRVVERRADYFRAMGETAKADAELQDLSRRLQQRGANEAVVKRYRDLAGPPEAPEPTPTLRTAPAAGPGPSATAKGKARRRKA